MYLFIIVNIIALNKLMKIRIILFLLIPLLGYILGNLFPISLLKVPYELDTLKYSDYLKLLISVLSAFITLIAMLLALFKDDIRNLWNRAKLNIDEKIETSEIKNILYEASSDSNEIIKALKYTSYINIINIGNIPSNGTEIYLEKLLYFEHNNNNIEQNIEFTSTALKWNGDDINIINIPPGGKKKIILTEIKCPEKLSTPDSANTNLPNEFLIGDIRIDNKKSRGKWIGTFCIYSQNHKKTTFEIEIKWNGIWKNRLSELRSNYEIKLKK